MDKNNQFNEILSENNCENNCLCEVIKCLIDICETGPTGATRPQGRTGDTGATGPTHTL